MITGTDGSGDGAVMRDYWSLAASLEHPTLDVIRDNRGWSQLSTPPTDVTIEAAAKIGVDGVLITPEHARHNILLLCLHGGGFLSGSSASHGQMYAHLAKAVGCQALVLDYPIAPEQPFPAAPDACFLAYRLLTTGSEVRQIILVGDSAGGNLALSTCQRAAEIDAPQPAAVVLFSPWLDLSLASPSLKSNQSVDPFFNVARLSSLLGAYLQSGEDPSRPDVSPIFGDLSGLPPIYIQVGDAEGLRDDGVRLAAACRDAGTTAECDVYEAMPHVFQATAGRDALADRAIAKAAAWINALCVADAR